MRTIAIQAMLILVITFSCDFSRSVKKDFQSGLLTTGKGLSCEEVYLAVREEPVQMSTFTYGEVLQVWFDDIEGFSQEDGRAYPGMRMLVISDLGDTVLRNDDLYAGITEGVDLSPLRLEAEVTLAKPIHSGHSHTLRIYIWDKKGKGTFNAKLEFEVVPDETIVIESHLVTCSEVYLYSQERGKPITNNRAFLDENIHLVFEGLEGFAIEEGSVLIGLGMRVTDASGQMLLDEEDLIGEREMDRDEVHGHLSPNFTLAGAELQNPVTVDINIWDKRGDGHISAFTQLEME